MKARRGSVLGICASELASSVSRRRRDPSISFSVLGIVQRIHSSARCRLDSSARPRLGRQLNTCTQTRPLRRRPMMRAGPLILVARRWQSTTTAAATPSSSSGSAILPSGPAPTSALANAEYRQHVKRGTAGLYESVHHKQIRHSYPRHQLRASFWGPREWFQLARRKAQRLRDKSFPEIVALQKSIMRRAWSGCRMIVCETLCDNVCNAANAYANVIANAYAYTNDYAIRSCYR